jgi:hypothetical protein
VVVIILVFFITYINKENWFTSCTQGRTFHAGVPNDHRSVLENAWLVNILLIISGLAKKVN